MHFLRRTLTMVLLWAAAFPAAAEFHLWTMSELYSSADGSVQFLELTSNSGGQQFLSGHQLRSVSGAVTHNFVFDTDLPGDTAGRRFLVGTTGYAALSGVPNPDYVVPNGFFFPGGGTITFGGGADTWTHGPTPTGNLSLGRNGSTAVNSPRNFIGQTGVIDTAPPPPPPSGEVSARTLGSRATVSPSATLYGGFEILNSSLVYILVRGNSLGTLGVTQGFLDAPRVRIYNSQGQDIVSVQGGLPGFNGCSASSAAATPVVNYYQNVRGQPAHERDGCIAQTLAAGPYTFTVTPSTPGVTTESTASAPNAGEVLFEVTLGGGGGSLARTLGSRATVAQAATLYGGFEIASSSVVYILVRGNSLGTLGVTQSYLDAPRAQLFDGQGRDLVTDSNGNPGFVSCLASNASQKPVFDFYSLIRHQPADGRDACLAQTLAPGVYTFAVTPTASSIPSAGEILFEVSLGR